MLLALGAGLGLAAAAAGLLARGSPGTALPADAIATVNGEGVRVEELVQAVAAVAADRRGPVGDNEKRRLLDRLVDEELLIQHGLALDLVRRDHAVRAALVSAVIELAMANVDEEEPTAAEVVRFYDAHHDYFTQPGRVRVRQVLVRIREDDAAAAAEARAREAAGRLRAGEAFATVRAALGDAEIAPLPEGWLPPAKLRDYLGPTPARTVLELSVGDVSEPVRSGIGFHVLQVLEREAPRTPALAEIEGEVRAELRRQQSDEALRARLDGLRDAADLRVAARLP
jgi:parvulin-like peptidyl-prolyl isomerase